MAHTQKKRGPHNALVGKPERHRPPVRPRHKWEDNIKTDIRETVCEGMDWIHLVCGKDKW